MIRCYSITELRPYIHWAYFFHAWQFEARFASIATIHGCEACRRGWLSGFAEADRPKAEAAQVLWDEAGRLLDEMTPMVRVQAVFRLLEAGSAGDDIHMGGLVVPFLRQQGRQPDGQPNLCLSDFVRPLQPDGRATDTVGVFATSVSTEAEEHWRDDAYRRLLAQTLASRLAEAAATRMHEEVRRTYWGYAPDEQLPMADLLAERHQGIRPAVGYPSIPDQSINFLIDRLLDLSRIGIRLTEHGAMQPHASVSGFLFAHPAARYFSIGPIGTDQLADYAARRGFTPEQMRPFLAANLKT